MHQRLRGVYLTLIDAAEQRLLARVEGREQALLASLDDDQVELLELACRQAARRFGDVREVPADRLFVDDGGDTLTLVDRGYGNVAVRRGEGPVIILDATTFKERYRPKTPRVDTGQTWIYPYAEHGDLLRVVNRCQVLDHPAVLQCHVITPTGRFMRVVRVAEADLLADGRRATMTPAA